MGLTPFQVTVSNELENDGTVYASFTVPADKRLVIEYVSGGSCITANDSADLGYTVSFAVDTIVGDVKARHEVPFHYVGAAWGYGKSYQAGQTVRLYADPGTQVTVSAANTLIGTGRIAVRATISGYLESVQ